MMPETLPNKSPDRVDKSSGKPEEINWRDIQYTEGVSHKDLVGTKIEIDGDLYEVVCEDHLWGEDTKLLHNEPVGELEIEGTCTVCGETIYTTVLGENARIID